MNELKNLISKHGISKIPWSELRSCPCQECGKKSLVYPTKGSALTYKDKSKIYCRSCECSFTLPKPKSTISQAWILARLHLLNVKQLEREAGLTDARLADVKRGRATLKEDELKRIEEVLQIFNREASL